MIGDDGQLGRPALDSEVDNYECRVCRTAGKHRTFNAREMMFGTREEFVYFQCRECACLQIAEIPENLGQYYPSKYYSFRARPRSHASSRFYRFLQRQRCRNALFGRGNKLNKLLSSFVRLPKELYAASPEIIGRTGIRSFNAPILDVGCGSEARWLQQLRALGFDNLLGADPFIESEIKNRGVRVVKKDISELSGKFELITFHHSLEHMSNQARALGAARQLLASDGVCLIRIPIVSSYAWQLYGVNWVEMDPPRHLYLHSTRSIRLLGEQVGLSLVNTVYDSLPLEFFGSEQYVRDIPLTAEDSLWTNPKSTIFSEEEKSHFDAMAKKVNQERTGGRAGFYFKHRQ